MGKSLKESDGFTLVEIVIAVLVVVMVVFIGWRVWDSRNDALSERNTDIQQDQGVGSANDSTSEAVLQSPSDVTYLDIPELGVRVPLESEAGAVVWELDTSLAADYPGAKRARFSSRELITASGETCGLQLVNPLGTVTVFAGTTDFFGNELHADDKHVFLLNDKYYLYQAPQSICSTDPSVEALAVKQRDAFVRGVRNMEVFNP